MSGRLNFFTPNCSSVWYCTTLLTTVTASLSIERVLGSSRPSSFKADPCLRGKSRLLFFGDCFGEAPAPTGDLGGVTNPSEGACAFPPSAALACAPALPVRSSANEAAAAPSPCSGAGAVVSSPSATCWAALPSCDPVAASRSLSAALPLSASTPCSASAGLSGSFALSASFALSSALAPAGGASFGSRPTKAKGQAKVGSRKLLSSTRYWCQRSWSVQRDLKPAFPLCVRNLPFPVVLTFLVGTSRASGGTAKLTTPDRLLSEPLFERVWLPLGVFGLPLPTAAGVPSDRRLPEEREDFFSFSRFIPLRRSFLSISSIANTLLHALPSCPSGQ
mmetsp:Transcript_15336/g.59950  ORF Transcript_15336/g.59950 Transcript_15336/m.59950 type:complete len:334 (-) Transcript_15336:139-1140(-)